jgi:hypothetical protein
MVHRCCIHYGAGGSRHLFVRIGRAERGSFQYLLL